MIHTLAPCHLRPTVCALKMDEHSLLAVASPHPDYQVFLQPELSTFTPEHSFFRVADWIYSHEKRRSMQDDHLNREAPPSPPRVSHKRHRLPAQYLVDRQEKDGRGRLRQALWQNPLAFYYYKQRHLFKPYSRSLRPKVAVSQIKTRPHTTAFHARARTSTTCRPQTSPVGPKTKLQSPKDQFTTLLEKCDQEPSARPAIHRTLKLMETVKESRKRFDWTQRTLSQISDCEADLIIPFYLSQREAFEDLYKDAEKSTVEYKKALVVPGIGVAKFERVLRRNKNQIL